MALIKTVRPIESISGKLQKKDQVCFAVRSKTKKNYTVTRDSWKPTFKSADNQAHVQAVNEKFKAVSRAARARQINPETMDADMLAYSNQSKYTTFFGYLFHLEWLNYED